MSVTQDVITDLLPVYFSGEASPDTRSLVESFFRDHPDFEKLARKSVKVVLPTQRSVAASGESEVLRRVQRKVRRRGSLLGFAIALTLAPLSFTAVSFGGEGTHLKWFMPRDRPELAVGLLVVAASVWLIYGLTRLSRSTTR